jgi:hypothetical protein
MSIKQWFVYELTCGHASRLPQGVIAYPFSCNVCHKSASLRGVKVQEWHARCQTPKCPFSAWTGASDSLAKQAADRHNKNTGHRVIRVAIEDNPAAITEKNRLEKAGAI